MLSRLAKGRDGRIGVSDHEGHCLWPETYGSGDEAECKVESAGGGPCVKGIPEGDAIGKSPCWEWSCSSSSFLCQKCGSLSARLVTRSAQWLCLAYGAF